MSETTPNTAYDLLVIGGGAAAENAADIATRGRLRVALVEHALLGSECSYLGVHAVEGTPPSRGAYWMPSVASPGSPTWTAPST